MRKTGLDVALEYGTHLPNFANEAEAERMLFAERDLRLAQLATLDPTAKHFQRTFDPDSLKALDRWYFELLDSNGFDSTCGLSQYEFERCIAIYLGELLVRARSPFEWFVAPYAIEGDRYEIGVRRGLVAIMLTRPMAPISREQNKRMQSLWRRYQRWAG